MTQPETVAVELAELRGEIRTGLEQIKGQLAVLVARTVRTDEDLKQLRTDTEKDIGELRAEVEALKRSRWPLAQLNALVAVGAFAAAVASLFLR
ncbi:hypothetical protein ACR9VJ_18050 [Streptomyces sp. H49]|uniref:hypothetical protein n=1 Tax=Streptomyces sp. H49 TaxID=3444117 RepID=UPI003F4AE03E